MTRWPYPRSIMIMMMVAVRAFDEDSERPRSVGGRVPSRAEPVAKELPTRTVGSLNWRLPLRVHTEWALALALQSGRSRVLH
jgi:hypothetical protein